MTPLRLILSVAALLGALVVAGFPWWTLVRSRRWPAATIGWCPLFGLAVVQVGSWLWLSLTGASLREFLVAVLAVSVVATAIILILNTRSRLRLDMPAIDRRVVAGLAIAIIGALLVLMFHYAPVLSRGSYTQPDGATADVAGYSLLGDELLDHGMYEAGHVTNADTGAQIRTDVFGAYAFVALGAVVLDVPAWQATLPALFVAALLGASALYALLRYLVGRHSLLLGLATVASCATFLVVYSATEYFLSQFLGMAPAAMVLLAFLLVADARARTETVRGSIAIAIAAAVLLLTYPQMLFFGVPVLALAAVAAQVPIVGVTRARVILRRSVRLLAAGLVSAVVVLMVLPNRASGAIDRVIGLGSGDAGWPLPRVLPSEVLGFQADFTWQLTTDTAVGSLVVIAATVAAAVAVIRRERVASSALAVIAGVLYAAYALVYLREGVSYIQGKWIAFFAPIVVGCVLALWVDAAYAVVANVSGARRRQFVAASCAGGLVAMITIQSLNAQVFSRWLDRPTGVPSDLAALPESEAVQSLGAVNAAMTTAGTGSSVWETAWAAYFLRQVPKTYLLNANLTALASACADWTLVRRDDPDFAQLSSLAVRDVNNRYALVRLARPQGRSLQGSIGFDGPTPVGSTETVLSTGPASDPNPLRVEYPDSEHFVLELRGVRTEPIPITPGARLRIDLVLDGLAEIQIDGKRVLADVPLTTPFGHGLLTGRAAVEPDTSAFTGVLGLEAAVGECPPDARRREP